MTVLIPDNTLKMGDVTVNYYPLTVHNPNRISLPTAKMSSVIGVTIHNTDWISVNGTTPAEQYTRATVNGNMKSVRVHYYVDNVCAWQNLPLTLTSWHAADGNGNGNMHTISIECIMSKNYNDKDRQSEDNAAKLAAELLKTYGLTIDNLYTHTHWLNVRDGKKGTVDELNVMHHNYKMCPAYILPHWQDFKEKVAEYMGKIVAVSKPAESPAGQIWSRLIAAGFTEAGTAGLMGNLKAESNLISTNLQNTFEKKLGYSDTGYTAAVDIGTYKGFVNDGAGYGLAQWTYHTRKQALLTFAKLRDVSIGDLDMQLDFLLKELQEGYTGLYNLLKITNDIQIASDAVLTQFERPADMSAKVKTRRAEYAKSFYNEFYGEKPSESVQNAADGAFIVKVVCDELNVRKGAGVEFDAVMQVHQGEAYTIVETAKADDGGIWGRLKSGAGWINIGNGYCVRV